MTAVARVFVDQVKNAQRGVAGVAEEATMIRKYGRIPDRPDHRDRLRAPRSETPTPTPPAPVPAPTAGCQGACDRAAALSCPWGGQSCVDTCTRYEAQGGALSWHPDCMAAALSCAAQDNCRQP